jgi:hypothetical protein
LEDCVGCGGVSVRRGEFEGGSINGIGWPKSVVGGGTVMSSGATHAVGAAAGKYLGMNNTNNGVAS